MSSIFRKFQPQLVLAGALLAGLDPHTALAQGSPQAPAAQAAASQDFDFFFGTWHVQNRRLAKPLQGSTQWESFDGIQVCVPLLGGKANYDELRTMANEPIGMSIHLFDQARQTWSSTWVSVKDGLMQPPVSGTFKDGVGIFEGDDRHEGQAIRVRYTWSRTNTPTPRWEQAFSADGGKTWETNWIMDYSRLPAASAGMQ